MNNIRWKGTGMNFFDRTDHHSSPSCYQGRGTKRKLIPNLGLWGLWRAELLDRCWRRALRRCPTCRWTRLTPDTTCPAEPGSSKIQARQRRSRSCTPGSPLWTSSWCSAWESNPCCSGSGSLSTCRSRWEPPRLGWMSLGWPRPSASPWSSGHRQSSAFRET